MSLADQLAQYAPPRPSFSAHYRAIYWEPIEASGERLTIGIMASNGEQYEVLQTISEQTLNVMFSRHPQAAHNLIKLTLDHARDFLQQQGDLNHWAPPLNCIIPGKVQQTRSNAEMNGILFQAVSSYASLYQGELLSAGLADHTSPTELIDSLQTLLLQNHLSPDAADYCGNHYTVNLLSFQPADLSAAVELGKAKLRQLARLQKKSSPTKQTFELIILLDSHAAPPALDNARLIQALGQQQNIAVITADSVRAIAERIQQKDRP